MTLSTAIRHHRPALMRGPMDGAGHDVPAFTGAEFFRFAPRLRPWTGPSSASCRATPEVFTPPAAQAIL